jgi:hypothetical protein
MKKTLWIAVVIVLALGVVGALSAGVAFAQGGQPPSGSMLGGRGYGPMHEYVEKALATKLGLTEKQVEDELAAGKTMFQIALDNGVEQEDLATFMNEVHQDAFAKAVEDGVMTREQADWMLQRMQNMYQNGFGPGNCPMHDGQGGGYGPGMMQNRGLGWGMMR